MAVLWSHATDLGIPSTTILNFEGVGRYGVFLFFVLSAFLLSRQILTSPIEKLMSFRYWLNYFLRRFFRIFPLFAIALAVYVLFHNWDYNKFPSTWGTAWYVLILQEKASVFWTVAVEFKFYLILPFIVLLFRKFMHDFRQTTVVFAVLLAILH